MATASSAPVVLLVEDNPAMRTLMHDLLVPLSARVHECADAETALDLCARLRPDWVLMDIQLGAMDGITATRAIRRNDPGVRVVIVTEHKEPEYRLAAEAAGAVAFVLKENLLVLPALLAGRGGAG